MWRPREEKFKCILDDAGGKGKFINSYRAMVSRICERREKKRRSRRNYLSVVAIFCSVFVNPFFLFFFYFLTTVVDVLVPPRASFLFYFILFSIQLDLEFFFFFF